jgi:hypothetical protein
MRNWQNINQWPSVTCNPSQNPNLLWIYLTVFCWYAKRKKGIAKFVLIWNFQLRRRIIENPIRVAKTVNCHLAKVSSAKNWKLDRSIQKYYGQFYKGNFISLSWLWSDLLSVLLFFDKWNFAQHFHTLIASYMHNFVWIGSLSYELWEITWSFFKLGNVKKKSKLFFTLVKIRRSKSSKKYWSRYTSYSWV